MAKHAKAADIVITTALIPGKPAPKLLSAEVVAAMKPGSVIVDLAAETGGNCALTRPGETVRLEHGVTVVGQINLPGLLAADASSLYAKNLLTFLGLLLTPEGLNLNLEDELLSATLVTHDGQIRFPRRIKENKMVDPFITSLTVFVLAVFVGYHVVWNVTPALHTPLMAVTNAISGIIIVGAMLQVVDINGSEITLTSVLGTIGIFLASINIFGGFLVTQRMLDMFKKRRNKGPRWKTCPQFFISSPRCCSSWRSRACPARPRRCAATSTA